ncbi:MAG: hypothetical protein QNJ77_04460 [Acidimicrobiia bacterium]|nr:hypothetical protein [Acidimicrobiia bacterium]
MRRREILVFIAAFAVVLLGGAALAQVGAFSSAPAADVAALSAASSNEAGTDVPQPVADVATEEKIEEVAETTEPPKEDEPKADETDKEPVEEEPVKDEPPSDEPPEEVDETPPPLEILFPENEQHFEEATIPFEGKTEPGARVFAGRYEADVDDEGNWRIVLILNEGGNLVKFKAKDAAGNITERSIKVFLDHGVATEFTAHQKWEVVDGYPAENKYYGTAAPGTKIWVGASNKGSGHTTANAEGEWSLRVKFEGAECGETFTVVVEAEGNHRKEFRMKYVCADHEFSAHQKYAENESKWTKFYGTGVPGTQVFVVSEYGSTETTVEGNGEWFAKLHFNDNLPANTEVLVVVEGEGGRAEFGFYWIVKTIDEIEFTAHQKYGSCGEAVPYDKFYGTATPGATIFVDSLWGEGSTTANEHGEWQVVVEFPDAPMNEPFTVEVESTDGGYATFTFVRTGEGEH